MLQWEHEPGVSASVDPDLLRQSAYVQALDNEHLSVNISGAVRVGNAKLTDVVRLLEHWYFLKAEINVPDDVPTVLTAMRLADYLAIPVHFTNQGTLRLIHRAASFTRDYVMDIWQRATNMNLARDFMRTLSKLPEIEEYFWLKVYSMNRPLKQVLQIIASYGPAYLYIICKEEVPTLRPLIF